MHSACALIGSLNIGIQKTRTGTVVKESEACVAEIKQLLFQNKWINLDG